MKKVFEVGQKVYFIDVKKHLIGYGIVSFIKYKKNEIYLLLNKVEKSLYLCVYPKFSIYPNNLIEIELSNAFVTDDFLDFEKKLKDYFIYFKNEIKKKVKKIKPLLFEKINLKKQKIDICEKIYFYKLSSDFCFFIGKGTICEIKISGDEGGNCYLTLKNVKNIIDNKITTVEITKNDAFFSSYEELEKYVIEFLEFYVDKIISLLKEEFSCLTNLKIK